MTIPGVLYCLLNMVLWAAVILFVLLVVSLILSLFWPGVPVLIPWPGQAPAPTQSRALSFFYVLVGIILLINFILCCYGSPWLPPLVGMR